MIDEQNEGYDLRSLMRLATWGTSAAFALALAIVSGFSATGSKRAAIAVAALTGAEDAPRSVAVAQLTPRPPDSAAETRRLNEAIRLLAADRDRLLTRVGSLERNVDTMTGSVSAQAPRAALPQSGAPIPAPEIDKPGTVTPAGNAPSWMSNGAATWPPPPAATLPPPPRSASLEPLPGDARPAGPQRTEFGVDLGSATTLEAAQAIWAAVKAQHGPLLGKLQPVVANRPNRSGVTEMRVIIGPLANAAAAAKLCATLGAADVMCSATTFSGDRLTAR
jgi:hypothetical protein